MRGLASSKTVKTTGLWFVAIVFVLSAVGSAVAEQYGVIYRFKNTPDGANPEGDLVSDTSGNLYGTTSGGGTSDSGTVYELSPPASGNVWTETVLYSFGEGNDGRYPLAGLVRDSAGNLFGSTFGGGPAGVGTIFELSPPVIIGSPWTETILHNFTGGVDGGNPQCKLLLKGGVLFGKGGVLFGTAFSGGERGWGAVFKLEASQSGHWIEQELYSFTGGSDGASPWPGLTSDKTGNLYGVTEGSGLNGNGTAFELSPPATTGAPWTETTLHSFGPSEGENPVGELLLDQSGNVYGMTTIGPPASGVGSGYGCGVVFQLVPPSIQGGEWTENLLYTLTGGSDGCNPYSGVILDDAGNLLGANSGDGGLNGNGAVFELSSAGGGIWTETTLHDFAGGNDGLYSYSTLVRGKAGAYYGTTIEGGSGRDYNGTIFKVIP